MTTYPPVAPPRVLYGAQGEIKTLQCPSGPPPQQITAVLLLAPQGNGTRFTHNHNIFSGAGFVFSANPGSIVLGRSQYAMMAGYPIFSANSSDPGGRFEGIFVYNTKKKLTDIQDGTSNTIMFGEYSNNWVDFGAGNALTGFAAIAWAGGPIYTYWDKGPVAQDAVDYPAMPRGASPWFRFASRHTGIMNICRGDGSVAGLNTSVSFDVWVTLGGASDGVVLTGNF